MSEAAKAKAALDQVGEAAKAEGAAETVAAKAAAAAHDADTRAIKEERDALLSLAAAAKLANIQELYGGRSSMEQHLADRQSEANLTNLVNRAHWLGFTTPQQAYAWRQQEYNQRLLMNRAEWAGYTTPDQYLQYLVKYRTDLDSLNSVMRSRLQLFQDTAVAASNVGRSLGEAGGTQLDLSSQVAGIQAFNDAVNATPDSQVTTFNVDDSQAVAALARDAALIRGIPDRKVVTIEVVQAAIGMGGVPLRRVVPGGVAPADIAKPLLVTQGAGGGGGGGPPPSILQPGEKLDVLSHNAPLGPEPGPGLGGVSFWTGLSQAIKGVSDAERGAAANAYVLAVAQQQAGLSGARLAAADYAVTGAIRSENEATTEQIGLMKAADDAAGKLIIKYLQASDAGKAALRRQVLGGPDPKASGSDLGGAGSVFIPTGGGGGGGGGGVPPAPPAGGDGGGLSGPAYVAALNQYVMALNKAGDASDSAANKTKNLLGAMTLMAVPLYGATKGWFGLGTELTLFAGILPGMMGRVALWHAALDLIIEAVAILVPALGVLAAGLAAFGLAGLDAATSVYNRFTALQTVANATGQSIAPLTGQLEKLHEQVRPMVWELYGDAIDVAATKNGLFNKLAIDTGHAIDTIAARITVLLTGGLPGLRTFISVGEANLRKLGEALYVLGNAFMNLIKVTEQTHIDQIFLEVFLVLAKLLDLITKLPTPLLAAVVALHAFWIWGGLLSTVLVNLLGPIRAVTIGMLGLSEASKFGSLEKDASAFTRVRALFTDLGMVATNLAGRIGLGGVAMRLFGAGATTLLGIPVAGWIIGAAVAAAGLSYWLATMPDKTEKWIASINKTVQAASIFDKINATAKALAITTQELGYSQATGTGNATELAKAQSDLSDKMNLELTRVNSVAHAYGTDMVGALQLMNTAGVKANDLFTKSGLIWDADLQKIKGLVDGYKAMGQGLDQLQGDISVQLVSNQETLQQMDKINQAWDKWTGLVIGGETTMVGSLQVWQSLQQELQKSGTSLDGLNSQSLAARNTYNQLIPNVGKYLDAVRNNNAALQDGAKGQQDLTRVTKDWVTILAQSAGASQQARDGVLAIAQQADPAINTWQKLTQWIGNKGVAGAEQDLNKETAKLETPLSNLQQDAEKLTTALQQDLTPAITKAWEGANNVEPAFNNFAKAVKKFGPDSQNTIDAAKQVAQILLAIEPNSRAAHDQFVAMLETWKVSAPAAEALWKQSTNLGTSLKQLPTKVQIQLGMEAQAAQNKLDMLKQQLKGATGHKRVLIEAEIKQAQDNLDTLKRKLGGMPNKVQIHLEVEAETIQTRITNLKEQLKGATGTKKLHIEAEIKDAQHNLDTVCNALYGAGNASDTLRGKIAGVGPEIQDLGKPGLWGQFEHGAMAAWDSTSRGFMTHVGTPVANFIKGPFVGFFTSTIPQAWDKTWAAIGRGFDQWWASHGAEVKQVWNEITSWISDKGGHAFHTLQTTAVQVWHFIHDFVVPIIKTIWDYFTTLFKIAFETMKLMFKLVWDTFVVIVSVILDIITGHWGKAWEDMKKYGIQVWNALKSWAISVWHDITTFVVQMWHDWYSFLDKIFVKPFAHFFTVDIPGFFTFIGKKFLDFVTTAWNDFYLYYVVPAKHLFTKDFPNWIGDIGRFFKNLWINVWHDFYNEVFVKFGNWVTNTMPTAVKNAFKGAINWVITNTINKVINFLNNDVLAHLPGHLHVNTVGPVAAGGPIGMAAGGPFGGYSAAPVGTSQTKGLWANGGSIPGPSAIDHFPILAMGGEYMLRQPARSAIDQTFGPAFLNRLNQADSWLGTGSRGTAASQGPQLWGNGYALGGLVNPIGPGAGPARIDMGVDYTGAFDVYALGAGTIRNVYNSGWPGGTFIDIQLNPPYGSGYWYSAENIAPSVSVGQGVSAGQKIGHARGSYPFTEFGWATGQGGQTAAARDHQIPTSGDPGAWSTAWGVAASQLIHSLGGPAGIFTQGSPGGKGLLSKIKGFLVSLWQNAEGLLNAAGNAVSSKLAPVGKFIAGGGKELLALAKKGARAVIDGIWDHTVTPIVNLVPSDSMPGEVLQLGAAKMKEAIDSFFSTQDKNAQAQAQSGAPGNLPAAAGPIVAYAKKLLAAYGWSNQWPAFNNLEMHEAGYDPHSQNPHSTAYGIGQFLDSTWATVGGTKTSDPYLQLQYMMKYIKQRYGDPNAAWAQYFQHPGGQGSYALGGVVIEQIKRATRNQHIQEAMALATYLDSGWNSNYSNQKANEYGAFAQRASKTHPASTWHNIGKAVALMMPRYQNGIGVVGPAKWGRDPEGAAKSTADWAESRNLPKLHGQAAVDRAWKEALLALGIKAPKPITPGPKGGPKPPPPPWKPQPGQGKYPPGGYDAEDAWQLYSTQLLPNAVGAEIASFWKLYNAKLPKTVKPADWASWYADELILSEQQHKAIGMSGTPAGAYKLIQEYFDRPEAISPYWWTNFSKQLNTLVSWQGGPGVHGGEDPPSSSWHYEHLGKWPKGFKVGHIKPRGYWGWKDQHALWQDLRNKLLNVKKVAGIASSAWKDLYAGAGTAGGILGPGTPAPQPAPPPIPGLEALVTIGGPPMPVLDLAPDGGYGFAAGGPVGAGHGVANGQVVNFAEQFALGGPVPYMPPSALSFRFGDSPTSNEFPRSLSAAGAAGRGIGLNVETMNINNPVSEQPSQSIARASNRLAFLAGRGMA